MLLDAKWSPHQRYPYKKIVTMNSYVSCSWERESWAYYSYFSLFLMLKTKTYNGDEKKNREDLKVGSIFRAFQLPRHNVVSMHCVLHHIKHAQLVTIPLDSIINLYCLFYTKALWNRCCCMQAPNLLRLRHRRKYLTNFDCFVCCLPTWSRSHYRCFWVMKRQAFSRGLEGSSLFFNINKAFLPWKIP